MLHTTGCMTTVAGVLVHGSVINAVFHLLQTMAFHLSHHPSPHSLEETLKIVQDQLTCGICLDTYSNAKVLQCFHTFCTKCLQSLECQRDQGCTVQCPNCCHNTSLPQTGVLGLQSAFHIAHLFDIRDTINRLGKAKCDKCKDQVASAYCRTCGFVCDHCKHIHQLSDDLTSHQVISLDQLRGDITRLVPPLNKALYCSQHQENELELFCEQCNQLICHNCTAKLHKGHRYSVVSDTFETHKAKLLASLVPVQQQLSTVRDSLQHLVMRRKEITDSQATFKTQITAFSEKLIATVNAKKEALIDELAATTHKKLQSLSAQEDHIKMLQATLTGCLEVVERSLQTGTQGEVMAAKKAMFSNIQDLTANFQPSSLLPREQADTRLALSHVAMEKCHTFGDLYTNPVCPEKCTLQGVPKLNIFQRGTIPTLQTFDKDGQKKECTIKLISCTLVSLDGTSPISGTVKRTGMGQYKLCFTAPRTGHYQLQVKVDEQHIEGSPFNVTVKDFATPIKTIGDLTAPWGLVINKRGHIIVTEYGADCITIISTNGDIISTFGNRGSNPGQLWCPQGVAVLDDDSVLVADSGNHRIQKFSPQGEFLETLGERGTNVLQFDYPTGIGIHPLNNQVYITDSNNHRVQVLDANLKYVTTFGSKGSDNGQFQYPYDISFDSVGDCYVADSDNGRVQVFTKDGQYLRQFGKIGRWENISDCISVEIYSDIVFIADRNFNRILLFTIDGCFLTSFWLKGSVPVNFNQPHGICVADNGLVYISDYCNDCIHVF